MTFTVLLNGTAVCRDKLILLFAAFDIDGNKMIDHDEFVVMMTALSSRVGASGLPPQRNTCARSHWPHWHYALLSVLPRCCLLLLLLLCALLSAPLLLRPLPPSRCPLCGSEFWSRRRGVEWTS